MVNSLGVILDSTLSWIPKSNRSLKKLIELSMVLESSDPVILSLSHKCLIESLVVPYLDYCCLVYSDTSKKLTREATTLDSTIWMKLGGKSDFVQI